jgi:hypothetical protein
VLFEKDSGLLIQGSTNGTSHQPQHPQQLGA